jgi:anti-sigma regulatory factor (Ser/Thr protein kinase)
MAGNAGNPPSAVNGNGGRVAGAAAQDGRRWRRFFLGEEAQLGELRRWLKSTLPDCSARNDVIVIASELGTNALRHTASGHGGWFGVEVSWHPSVLRIAVADCGGTAEPRIIDDLDAENGRGLLLVRGLSERTGVTGDQRGRMVWAEIAWDGPEPDDGGLVPDGREAASRSGPVGLARLFAGVPTWFGRSALAWQGLAGPGQVGSVLGIRQLARLLYRLGIPAPPGDGGVGA